MTIRGVTYDLSNKWSTKVNSLEAATKIAHKQRKRNGAFIVMDNNEYLVVWDNA